MNVRSGYVRGTIAASALIGLAGCASTALTPLSRQTVAGTSVVPVSPTQAEGPLVSAATVTTFPGGISPGSRITRSTLRMALDALLDRPLYRTASWGALILGPAGDTLYARASAKLMVPASNMKIVTGAVALALLGPEYQFRSDAIALPLRDTVPSDFGPMYDTAFVRTHTLRDVLPKMLKPSQNRLAEQLFQTLALVQTGVVSHDSAAAVERRQLAAWGVPMDGAVVRDGSGFDRGDYLSPETITIVLHAIQRDTAFSVFYNALPVAGVDGTLAGRMRATAAERNAHAKTGSLGAVRALAGYVTTPNGEVLVFSVMCNGFTVPSDSVTATMDRAVALIAGVTVTQ